MKHKLAGCPRTWHSLWDEMFSAFAPDLGSAEGTTHKAQWRSFDRAPHPCQASNDNADPMSEALNEVGERVEQD
jgi:hypothetical protein